MKKQYRLIVFSIVGIMLLAIVSACSNESEIKKELESKIWIQQIDETDTVSFKFDSGKLYRKIDAWIQHDDDWEEVSAYTIEGEMIKSDSYKFTYTFEDGILSLHRSGDTLQTKPR